MAERIPCTIFPRSTAPHLSQIYTGFALLHRRGRVSLTQKVLGHDRPLEARTPPYNGLLRAELGRERLLVYYDVHDSPEIDRRALDECQLYFKRSFAPDHARLDARLRPLGLNYEVDVPGDDPFARERARTLPPWQRIRRIVRASGALDGIRHRLTAENGWAPPRDVPEPRILFMARAWPAIPGIPVRGSDPEALSETRAAIVRALRQRFGPRFSGGLVPDAFARSRFPDALVQDPRLCRKGTYLRRLADFSICIATEGLHRSNGWKLAEYVCFSKAIVSEPLVYAVPGPFASGEHYLEYTTAEECVRACERLVADPALRSRMMASNHQYYDRWLRPDVLVERTLETALRS